MTIPADTLASKDLQQRIRGLTETLASAYASAAATHRALNRLFADLGSDTELCHHTWRADHAERLAKTETERVRSRAQGLVTRAVEPGAATAHIRERVRWIGPTERRRLVHSGTLPPMQACSTCRAWTGDVLTGQAHCLVMRADTVNTAICDHWSHE